MAGDHKCPVCQSTFTRPQHVARHMRSHTGDRPYKCQHCGDQFARSDLLSRHVNKCHASEKPPTTTLPNRRKGSAAASRATTSKQACDQCVTSSLPCDGANPCSKCVQRKCRCTYVKFSRQTMPQGPGHPVPNQIPPAGRGLLPGSSRLPEDFVLAPPQSSFGFPPMYSAAGSDYALPPASALYPAGFSADGTATNPTLSLPAGASPELIARYRAELLSRANVLPHQSSISLNGAQAANTTDGVLPAHPLYNDPQAQVSFNRYSLPMPAASNNWAQDAQQSQQSFHALDEHRKDYGTSYPGARDSFHAREGNVSSGAGEPSLQTHPPAYGSAFPTLSSASGSAGGYHGAGIYHNQRSESLSEDFSSDGGSTNHSHSLPGSAQSSNVHLPLPDQSQARPSYSLPGFTHLDPANANNREANNSNNGSSQSGPNRNEPAFGQDGQGEGGFSSAFGLMSLDDPNVLAGLASDSAPFFSNLTPGASGLSLQTPTQDILAALKTGKSDGDNKDMRDFWKMYVRTPLSGPGANNGFSLATPTGPGQMLGVGRPSPTRRHSRVASLPSIKTPTALCDSNSGAFPSLSRFPLHIPSDASRGHRGQQEGEQRNEGNGNVFSSMRTTLYDADDLKSYEQAVLARKTPMNLNLVPKRRGTMPAGTAPPSSLQQQAQDTPNSDKANSTSPNMPHLPSNKIPDLLNRPSSSSSINSSLAHAFGGAERPSPKSGPQPQTQMMRPPSGGSSSTTAVGSDAGTDSDSSYRPSFKRLASQTLGPEHTKRALLGPAGWDDDAADDDDDDDASYGRRSLSAGADESNQYGAVYDRPMVALPDRHRRPSVPTTDKPLRVRMEQSAAPS
ncbi:hypothetical protein DAEQUDRAFT_493615 [Daedalea quercina L-15889]|uniref:Zn(2)-C6 fungal-type domain-containing protein n=1 Tax=Daedalea quercina L-15889 TaxID=1314783 RepID=A0A165MMI7_9APHY|nr:hypothetical protein DAEQUDRAFT_493615 [Daedalea quercina L-15889]